MSMSRASLSVTSPDLSVLAYSALYDISGPTPEVVLTNESTVINATALTWWYVITTPSGLPLHTGSVTTPDKLHLAWTTFIADTWPQPFGTPPFSQVEFSCSVPYICTLYVKDSENNTFSLPINTVICRPNGNTSDTQGNFGAASTNVSTDCQTAQVRGADTTNYTYQNQLGTSSGSKWTLVYPLDNNGNQPANGVVNNAANVSFNIGYTGKGYQLSFNTYSIYDLGNGGGVKLQYKFLKTFGVWCNVDLCKLQCEIANLYELSKKGCGTVQDPELMNKITRINLLFNQVLAAVLQPLCDVDVPALINEIQKIGGFNCNCCSPQGINLYVPVPVQGCCPISVPVYQQGTTNPPATCPDSYFPANIYGPDGTTLIGVAYSMDDELAIINSTSSWQAYGIFFNEGNCKVGVYPSTSGATVPPIEVVPTGVPGGSTACTPAGTQTYTVAINNSCGSSAITDASYPFVASVDFGAGAVSLGAVANVAALIVALNVTSTKPIAVTFSAGSSGGVLTVIINNTDCDAFSTPITITGCVQNTIQVIDTSTSMPPAACPASFYPVIVYAPDGITPLGIASSADDMVSIMNADAGWQVYGVFFNAGNCNVGVTLATGVSTVPNVIVNTDTSTGSGCVDSTSIYQLPVLNYCLNTPISTLSYPFFAYVDYGDGGGIISLESVDSLTALITALNDNSSKPLPITFSAGSGGSSSQIEMNVINANCIDFPASVIVYAALWPKDFVMAGGNHHNLVNGSGGSLTFLRASTNATLGKTCIYPTPQQRPFHTIKIGSYLFTTEPTTGRIYVYFVGDVLNPSLIYVIQLNTVVAGPHGNFTGFPSIYGELSYFNLYFPTDYIDPSSTSTIYVVESTTGTIWAISTTSYTVTNSFQSDKLLGKCPRQVLLTAGTPTIYFTQDGHVEQDGGLSSTIPTGSVIQLNATTFNAGAISTVSIDAHPTPQNIVASSFNSPETIIYTGDTGGIWVYNKTTAALTGDYVTRWFGPGQITWTRWANTSIFNGFLYLASYGAGALGGTYKLALVDISGSGDANGFENMTGNGQNIYRHYNFIGIAGTCYGFVTFYNDIGSATGVGKFKFDGTFLEMIPLLTGDIYNVVPIEISPSIPSTPNSYCALP